MLTSARAGVPGQKRAAKSLNASFDGLARAPSGSIWSPSGGVHLESPSGESIWSRPPSSPTLVALVSLGERS
jgi:hypothetical protein